MRPWLYRFVVLARLAGGAALLAGSVSTFERAGEAAGAERLVDADGAVAEAAETNDLAVAGPIP